MAGKKKLAKIFPRIYNITFTKQVTIKFVKESSWECFTFKRSLHGDYLEQWDDLKKLVDEVKLNDSKDRLKWPLNSRNKFVVKELYLFLKSSALVGFKGI